MYSLLQQAPCVAELGDECTPEFVLAREFGCDDQGGMIDMNKENPKMKPDATADKLVRIELVRGSGSGEGLYLNDIRIAGTKPMPGGQVVKEWDVPMSDLLDAAGIQFNGLLRDTHSTTHKQGFIMNTNQDSTSIYSIESITQYCKERGVTMPVSSELADVDATKGLAEALAVVRCNPDNYGENAKTMARVIPVLTRRIAELEAASKKTAGEFEGEY